jgi:hypothetical protein
VREFHSLSVSIFSIIPPHTYSQQYHGSCYHVLFLLPRIEFILHDLEGRKEIIIKVVKEKEREREGDQKYILWSRNIYPLKRKQNSCKGSGTATGRPHCWLNGTVCVRKFNNAREHKTAGAINGEIFFTFFSLFRPDAFMGALWITESVTELFWPPWKCHWKAENSDKWLQIDQYKYIDIRTLNCNE